MTCLFHIDCVIGIYQSFHQNQLLSCCSALCVTLGAVMESTSFVMSQSPKLSNGMSKDPKLSNGTSNDRTSLTDRLEEASIIDKKWLPQIYVQDEEGKRVDLMDYLDPSLEMIAFFPSKGYPKSASFRFDGFSGTNDQQNIIRANIDAAFSTGSMIRASKRTQKTAIKIASVDFFVSKQN